MPFAIKQNKKIKIQGSLETLRHFTQNKTLYWLQPWDLLVHLNDKSFTNKSYTGKFILEPLSRD